MAYKNIKRYRLDRQVLYNNVGTNSLYGQHIKPDSISSIALYKRIFAGSIWTNKGILKRAKVLSPYDGASDRIVVNYPYPFAVGDTVYIIGDSSEDNASEANAVNTASATELGEVTAIDGGNAMQTTELTPSGIAEGDVITVDLEGASYSYVASTTDVAEIVAGIKKAMASGLRSHHSVIDFLDISEDGSKLTLKAKESGETFMVTTNVIGNGSLDVEVTSPVGTLTITPSGSGTALEVGAKIGTIDQVPLGIIAHEFYLSDDDGLDTIADIAAYDTANVYKRALPYLDGQVVSSIPTLKYIPAYGEQQ